jgi:Uma2 family endonuclease
MNYEEYLELAPDSQKMEWVNGDGIVYMPTTNRHQNLSRFLTSLLDAFILFFKIGEMRYATFEAKLWPGGPSREPDILFMRNENLVNLSERRFEGGPDLVVEIVSRGSVKEDRVDKFAEYQQAGVREYWLFDSRPHQEQADFYVLGGDGLFHVAPVNEDGVYFSTVLPGFWLNLAWLWDEPLPNPQRTLAEIMLSIEELPEKVKETYRGLYELLREG